MLNNILVCKFSNILYVYHNIEKEIQKIDCYNKIYDGHGRRIRWVEITVLVS